MAVKVLSVELESMRGEREFVSEIAALSDIKHENLVNLRGCCVDGAHRLLVYDYMENNSLSLTFLGNFLKLHLFKLIPDLFGIEAQLLLFAVVLAFLDLFGIEV
uniref:ATP binding protein n=1 Tax=Solanum tuberosum TaxID=4113 RepID=M1BVL8_SOLTU